MKANTKKRKIFEDAIDLMTGDEAKSNSNDICSIPIERIKPYHDHPFRLYEGERLEDMVGSIKEHGILNPVIVNESDGEYEMLSGHNRLNAARIAGLKEVPAFVKKGLTEEEAYIYVIETNVMQRSFAELLPSEKAAVMSEHYQKICGTMKKDEILLELGRLNQESASKKNGGHNGHYSAKESEGDNHSAAKEVDGGHHGHQTKTRDIVAAEYGFSSRNAARYLRINHLIRPFKDMIDDNRMALLAGVDISYLTEAEQRLVWEITDNMDWKIKPKTAAELRARAGSLTDKIIADIFEEPRKKQDKGISIKISGSLRSKYFKGMETKEMIALIDKALEAWYCSQESA